MERQLVLLDDQGADRELARGAVDWRLDDETRQRGRQGVAAARAALAGAVRRPAA